MKFTRVLLIGAFVFCSTFVGFAQEQLGLRFENYSGINGVTLNPAHNLTSRFKWDINLVTLGVFAENDYAYIGNTNLIHLLKNSNNILSAPDLEDGFQPTENDLIADYFDNSSNKFFSLNTQVMGPSFMVKLESGHSFGAFTNVRAVSNSRNIPFQLGYYHFDRTPLNETIEVPPLKVAGMAWSEIGINYAFQMPTDYGSIGFGANLKFLQGYEGFYLANESTIGVQQLVGDTIVMDATNFHFALTDSNADESNDFNLTKNGGGFGLDLGAIMTIEGYGDTYKWKFGFSILDIGKVNFNQNVERHLFQTNESVRIPANDYKDLENNAEAYLQRLSTDILGDSLASKVAGGFEIWLPTALSLQADYLIRPNLYVNASLVQRMPMGNISLSRDNILAISPRFESRWLGASLPLVLYNYQDFRMGASLRLAFFTFGTEHLGSIFRKDTFTGTDFYMAVKINPFKLNLGGGGGRGKGVRCYDF